MEVCGFFQPNGRVLARTSPRKHTPPRHGMTNAYPGATKQTSWPTPPLHLTTPDHAAGLTSVRPVEKGTSCSKVRLCSPDAEAAATIKSISKHPIHDRATVAAFQQLASQQDGSAKAMLRTPDFSFPAKNAKCQKSIYTTDMIQSKNRARDGGRPCQVVARLERLAPKPICYVTTRWFQTIMISSWGWAYSWQPNRYAGPVNKAPLPQT
ncbi:hypothetical protein LXG23DRAFT_36761 [Yarrowia lipolytica]|nr:hypothetical protein BKA91DRAFT_166751 [Yarrowia lipolytica]KAE8172676.1 hypothetical protein BKA90DRAFT_168199 [Yarrowia lipolytica]KAJ8054666.1 hypothetical protein LXG23DRAFT_36761 [Yarrowia lipolytica]RMI99599.1 hypothetical protein BD777DRAFT_151748 [Yarrowia lipolytica]